MSRYRITTCTGKVYEQDALNPFAAAHQCGMGSGDIALAKFELLGPSYDELKRENKALRISVIEERGPYTEEELQSYLTAVLGENHE